MKKSPEKKEPKKRKPSAKKVSIIEEAFADTEPLTEKEADAIADETMKLMDKLSEKYGEKKFSRNVSTMQAIRYNDGMCTSVRGNAEAGLFVTAQSLANLIEDMSNTLNASKEGLLLVCITELGNQVRTLWNNQKFSSPKNNEKK